MPLLQDLDQAWQCLIVSWVHQLTGGQRWQAFYELTQEARVVSCEGHDMTFVRCKSERKKGKKQLAGLQCRIFSLQRG